MNDKPVIHWYVSRVVWTQKRGGGGIPNFLVVDVDYVWSLVLACTSFQGCVTRYMKTSDFHRTFAITNPKANPAPFNCCRPILGKTSKNVGKWRPYSVSSPAYCWPFFPIICNIALPIVIIFFCLHAGCFKSL